MADKRDSLKRAHVYKEKNNKKGYVDPGIKPSDRICSEYPMYYSLSKTVVMKTDPGRSCPEETNEENTVTTRTAAGKTVVAIDVRGILSKMWHPGSTASSFLAIGSSPNMVEKAESFGKLSLHRPICTETKSASAGKALDITNNWEDADEQIIAENLSELTGDIAQKIQELLGQVQHINTKPKFALTQEERKLIEEFDELIDLQSFLENPHECLATQYSIID